MPVSPGPIAAPPHFALRMGAFFGGYFVFGGIAVPFYPVWLQAQGLSEVEIANCIAVPAIVRVLLTPLAGMIADRAPNRRFAAIAFTFPAALIFLLAWPFRDYWPLLFITAASFTLWSLALPVAEALALAGVRQFGIEYGRMRVGGSIAYIITNLGAGALLGMLDVQAIFWFVLAALISSTLVAFALPVNAPAVRARDDATRPEPRRMRDVLGHPGFLTLLLVGGLIQASHAVLYSFGSIHWRALGFSGPEIGAFWAIGVCCEIVMFTQSGFVIRLLGPLGLLSLGAVAAIVRWTFTSADPGFAGFLALQALHGLTFGGTYLGNQHAIARVVPEEMTASAQGLFGTITAVLMAATTAAAGPLYESFGAGAYRFMIVLPVTALIILAAYGFLNRQRA